MIKVALTGGIGSGKSTVAQLFEKIGIPIYYSDSRAKTLMNGVLREDIEKLFGENAYIENRLNTRFIAPLVFSDSELLGKLNNIVHPAVVKDFNLWANEQSTPYVMIETAILLESHLDKAVDKIVVVTAPLEERIRRTITRDNTTREAVLSRIAAQTPQEKLLELANHIIDTTPEKMTLPQVDKINNELRIASE